MAVLIEWTLLLFENGNYGTFGTYGKYGEYGTFTIWGIKISELLICFLYVH